MTAIKNEAGKSKQVTFQIDPERQNPCHNNMDENCFFCPYYLYKIWFTDYCLMQPGKIFEFVEMRRFISYLCMYISH